jgi:pilus assembly protein CpaE
MPPQSNNAALTVAIVNVCVAPDAAQVIDSVVQSRKWQINDANFDSYISAERRPSIPPQMKAADLRIAFVDFDADAEDAAESTKHLKQIFHAGITVIAIGKPRDPDLLLMAMRAGCNEFLQKPVSPDALTQVLFALEYTVATPEQERERGTILSFFGAKGGVGTTTIAVHLAMYLVQCHGKRTLLIDNHPELGHVCVYLGLDGSKFNFQEVVHNVSRLDSELLRGYVAKHVSGLEVLSSPETCGATGSIVPESMSQTLEFLRGEYDFIVIDSATSLDDASIAIIESSAQSYLVAAPEIASLRDLSRYLDAFKHFEEISNKIQIVLNRFPSSTSVSLEQIESAIGKRVSIKLPTCHPELQKAENLGKTLAPGSKSDFGTQIVRWASGLAGSAIIKRTSPKEKKAGFFSWKQTNEVAH